MNYEVGFNIPAEKGMSLEDVQTPALIIDYDIFFENMLKMKNFVKSKQVFLRPHAKMHKSPKIAEIQHKFGGARGICCQKVSEAEVFARFGIKNILITNQVTNHFKIDRLTKIPNLGCKVGCCVDNIQNVIELQKYSKKNNTHLDIYVEFDCGANRCGLKSSTEIKALINFIKKCENLNFIGLQAYNGSNQHILDSSSRNIAVRETNKLIRNLISELKIKGIYISGGGTGCFQYEVEGGLYNEIQVGSYLFMDGHYSSLSNKIDRDIIFKNSLFILTSVMSTRKDDFAVVDAGLKSMSVDSGLPNVFHENKKLSYIKCSDEHGIITNGDNHLKINDKVLLVPGHCDPTCNLHDWYVVIKNNLVIDVWPISARGYSY